MLIQCAADFHGKTEKYREFIKAYKEIEPDIVIIAGDLGFVEKEVFDEISSPIYAVYGNMDGDLSHLENKIEFIDGKTISFKNIKLHGFINEKIEEKVDIIVSHYPPYKARDKTFFGMHIGSKVLAEVIEEIKPKYVICGHVHECYGYEKYNDCYIINCSIGKKGKYTIINYDKEVKMVGYL